MAVTPKLDGTYPALIFKASRDTLHHGALGIVRTLGRLGVPVYAVVEDRCTPVAASRYLTKAFVWKDWLGDRAAFLSAMATIGQLIAKPTILIPIDDLSAVLVAENADALGQWFRFPKLPPELPRQLANKANLYALCAKVGVSCPKAIVPHSIDDIRKFVEQTTFPIVAKAADQWLLLNDRYSAIIIPTRKALLEFYEHTKPEDRSRLILQEYIPGEDWIYHGYCNCETNLYVSFTGRKLLSYPPITGSTALGVSVRNDALRTETENLLKAISYSGITDMDWRQDSRDGQYKMLDCNPRVGMNFRLFENSAGIDVVRALHLDLTHRSVDNSTMIEGRYFAVESFYFLASLRGWRPGALRNEMRALAESKVRAWWSSDDRIPFYLMSIRLLARTIRRALKQAASYLFRRVHD